MESTTTIRRRTFLLSPANSNGRRGALLQRHGSADARAGLHAGASSQSDGRASTSTGASPMAAVVDGRDLAYRLAHGGAPLGEVFAFISSLYFRGKLAYARTFTASAFIITPSRGLLSPDTLITPDVLEEFAGVDVDPANTRYREPMDRDLAALARELGEETEVVLFGSIATGKYVDVLLPHFGDRLRFPDAFIGRGDMSRGGLMLRAAAAGEELSYVPLAGATRRGARPPKLAARAFTRVMDEG
jgi:hypothetical protein